MKNIIIAGSSRVGKSTLARKINEELNYFVISIDKLVAILGEAYPQLNIKLNWDREKTTNNIAPFLGHFLGMFSSPDGSGLLSYSHGNIEENNFVLEGGYVDFEKILPILKAYGKESLKDHFLLIGLVQNRKTADDFVRDFKKYDTKDDWTYSLDDNDLREVSEDAVSFNKAMFKHLKKYGFTIYDTSTEREQILEKIIDDIKSNLI